jgi:hypothetical protein
VSNKAQTISAALLTTVLAGGITSACGQQSPAARAGEQSPAPTLTPGRQPPVCDVILEVNSTDPDGQGHLKMDQWLRFLGPIPNQGHMLVIPMDRQGVTPHAWRPGTHVAYRTTPPQDPPPWKFFLEVPVLSPPEHTSIAQHKYTVTVNAPLEEGCPRHIRIETLPEDDEITDDHPGHAVLD